MNVVRHLGKGSCLIVLCSILLIWFSISYDSNGELYFDFGKVFIEVTSKFNFFKEHADDFSKLIEYITKVGSKIISTSLSYADRVWKIIDLSFSWFNSNVVTTVVDTVKNTTSSIGDYIRNVWNSIFG